MKMTIYMSHIFAKTAGIVVADRFVTEKFLPLNKSKNMIENFANEGDKKNGSNEINESSCIEWNL